MHQNAVGDDMYVFSNEYGKPSPGIREVLILSHGGKAFIRPQFSLPNGLTMHFYTPHGYVARPPTPRWAAKKLRNALPTHTQASASPCQDYILTKWVAKKDGGYSPNAVEQIGYEVLKSLTAVNRTFSDREFDSNDVAMDIVTIRQARFRRVTLSGIIRDLRKNDYNYSDYYCCFCRGSNDYFDA